ncbi:unnamed protein product, partial [Urochloa humidicola]
HTPAAAGEVRGEAATAAAYELPAKGYRAQLTARGQTRPPHGGARPAARIHHSAGRDAACAVWIPERRAAGSGSARSAIDSCAAWHGWPSTSFPHLCVPPSLPSARTDVAPHQPPSDLTSALAAIFPPLRTD